MASAVANGIEASEAVDDGILHLVTMTEREFRDLLRLVAEEMRREHECQD